MSIVVVDWPLKRSICISRNHIIMASAHTKGLDGTMRERKRFQVSRNPMQPAGLVGGYPIAGLSIYSHTVHASDLSDLRRTERAFESAVSHWLSQTETNSTDVTLNFAPFSNAENVTWPKIDWSNWFEVYLQVRAARPSALLRHFLSYIVCFCVTRCKKQPKRFAKRHLSIGARSELYLTSRRHCLVWAHKNNTIYRTCCVNV